MRRPFVVGICGGIGSGKSAAARVFQRLGAEVIDADAIAHQVLKEPAIRAAVKDRFGAGVIAGAAIDREALARLVFGGLPSHDAARAALERIVHPRILALIEAELAALRSRPFPSEVVVIDAPLLVDTPLKEACDEIVFVDAPEKARMARTGAERNWTPDHHRAREKAQGGIERKKSAATRVLDNRGSLADLESAAAALYAGWTQAP